MNEEEKQLRDMEYNEYVKKITPKHSCFKNCICAFITGGIICVIGQLINDAYVYYGMEKNIATQYTTVTMILLSVLLTALNIYPAITKWGGAGGLVPITGFANSVAATAIEYKKEGQVFGIGCKIFTIAGPVILYGILSSFLAGFIYWVLLLM